MDSKLYKDLKHRQVEDFRPKGYGLLVLDLLGAGWTSEPEDADVFRSVLLARDIVDLLDAESLDGSRRGSAPLSRLANVYSERFNAFVWLSKAYIPPAPQPGHPDKTLAALKEKTSGLGYWKFFMKDGVHGEIGQNIDSFLQLIYPTSPELWALLAGGGDTSQNWTAEKRAPGIPGWLTRKDCYHIRAGLLNGGVKSLLNYYRVTAQSLNVQDSQTKHDRLCFLLVLARPRFFTSKPTLFVVTSQDMLSPPSIGVLLIEKYIAHAKIEKLDVGHWIQLEATEKLNSLLVNWIESQGLRK
ncbi:alpha/beta-hydrolase [Trametes elegans]|nr:alpha/beta-hydrolase [Trametes elegans]